MINAFGVELPRRTEGLRGDKTAAYIRHVLARLLAEVGVDEEGRAALVNMIASAAHRDDYEYEDIVHGALSTAMSQERLVNALRRRARQISNQITPFLKRGASLDLGCGDARLSEFVKDAAGPVFLVDVYHHEDTSRTGLPFVVVSQNDPLPLRSEVFENVILCTVLHHAEDPVHTLREAARVTRRGGRLIIHESVHGISQDSEKTVRDEITAAFVELSAAEQLVVNSFFDHFYNRCLFYSPHADLKVSVPYNFLSPTRWVETLRGAGLSVQRVEHFGVDLEVAPLFHTLFIAEKPEAL